MSNDSNQFVQTVTGPVQLDSLGITLTHEHLSCIFEKRYEEKLWWLFEAFTEDSSDEDRSLNAGNIFTLKRYPYISCNNLSFNELKKEIISYELSLFKSAGGKTVVENSSIGLECDINTLKLYSSENEINIIVGTGFLAANLHDDIFVHITYEEIYNRLLNDLTVGIKSNNNEIESSKIKAGFIGEISNTWPINEFEKLSIRATGEVQSQLHCPVNLNPGVEEEELREVIRIYQEAGGDSKKAVISNIDRRFWYEDKFMEFMDDTKHIYLQFDLFGIEHSFFLLNNKYYKILSDAQRIKRLAKVKEEGHLDRILISHDIHTKDRFITYGGHGYAHILKNIVPHMLRRNFTVYDITMLTTENPKKWLTWN